MKRFWSCFFVPILLLAALTACAQSVTPATTAPVKSEASASPATDAPETATAAPGHISVMGVKFDLPGLTLRPGERRAVAARVLPEDASDPSLIYEVSDPAVISYGDGAVTALSAGTAVLIARSVEDGYVARLAVVVEEEPGDPTDAPTSAETPATGTSTPETPTPNPFEQPEWLLRQTEDAGMSYQNRLIFLGDSTTAGMIPYKVLPDGENTRQVWRGAVGNTITFLYLQDVSILYPDTDTAMPILDAVSLKQPPYLVITLGVTGGVSQHLDKESFLSLYRWLIDGILEKSPDTRIIVQSIFPVEKERNTPAGNYTAITNEEIERDNGWLKEMTQDYFAAGKNLRYSDVYPLLLGSDGWMDPKYGNGDGLHIGPEGYAVILNYLRTHAWQ